MKKGFKTYAVAWAILLALFNVVIFALPNEFMGYTKLDATFWTAYGFITLAFIGQLICANIAFRADNGRKLFYNIPLITVSYTGLILTMLFGSLTIAVPNLPHWVGIILCSLILGFTAIAAIKAKAAAELVEAKDEQIKAGTSFIRSMTAEAESLMARAQSPEAKAACKKVYEALRYSDPVSSPELSILEAKITCRLDELAAAVGKNDSEAIRGLAREAELLIAERSSACKLLK